MGFKTLRSHFYFGNVQKFLSLYLFCPSNNQDSGDDEMKLHVYSEKVSR